LANRRIEGKPCIKGTRIMISVILDYVRAGEPRDEVLRQYPTIKPEDIDAAVAFADRRAP
jgi:uncharacterized protein (DUF433 family)